MSDDTTRDHPLRDMIDRIVFMGEVYLHASAVHELSRIIARLKDLEDENEEQRTRLNAVITEMQERWKDPDGWLVHKTSPAGVEERVTWVVAERHDESIPYTGFEQAQLRKMFIADDAVFTPGWRVRVTPFRFGVYEEKTTITGFGKEEE